MANSIRSEGAWPKRPYECFWSKVGVCACALMQVLLLPIGRGFTGQCLDIGAWDLASAIADVVAMTCGPTQEMCPGSGAVCFNWD